MSLQGKKVTKFIMFTTFAVTMIVISYNIVQSENMQFIKRFNIETDRINTDPTAFEIRIKGPLHYDDPELIEIIRQKYLLPPSIKPYNLETSYEYLVYKTMWSWVFLQPRIQAIFENVTNGFFVEAGALDGQYLSNTLSLERFQNWTGLLVEANPSSFKALLTKNRKAWLSPACLSPYRYPLVMLLEKYDVQLNNLWRERGGTHLKDTETKVQEMVEEINAVTAEMVQCVPLATLLLALNVSHIDFLSLDVEGAEKGILESFPWDLITISVLAVENQSVLKGKDENLLKFFTEKGYREFAYITDFISDHIFVKNDFWNDNRENLERIRKNINRDSDVQLMNKNIAILHSNMEDTYR